MTTTEKYVNMNNCFCKLRDAIYESDVDEAEEDPAWSKSVEQALTMLLGYIDYYKDLNGAKSHIKGTVDEQQSEEARVSIHPTGELEHPSTILDFRRYIHDINETQKTFKERPCSDCGKIIKGLQDFIVIATKPGDFKSVKVICKECFDKKYENSLCGLVIKEQK